MAKGTEGGEMADSGLFMDVVGMDGGKRGVACDESTSESCVVVPSCKSGVSVCEGAE